MNTQIMKIIAHGILNVDRPTDSTYADVISNLFKDTNCDRGVLWADIKPLFKNADLTPSDPYSYSGASILQSRANLRLRKTAESLFNYEARCHAHTQFENVGQVLEALTNVKQSVETVDDPANLYCFNLVTNNSWQTLTPAEQRQIISAKDLGSISVLINNLAKRIEKLEN